MRSVVLVSLLMLMPSGSQAQPTSTASIEGPRGYVLWSASRVEMAADRLERRLGNAAMVYETVGTYDDHSIYLVLRGKTGPAELHETESDLYIAKRGSATFVIGGQLVDAERRPLTQRRGSSITGGTSQTLSPGDVVHVSEATAHHLLVDPAEPFMYILIKFDEERPPGSRTARP